MSARKKITLGVIVSVLMTLSKATPPEKEPIASLASESLARQLGWVQNPDYHCGGYYIDQPFIYPISVDKDNSVEITSDQTLFSRRSTSILEGSVTLTRSGQQLTANKAYLYRDPVTGKLSTMDVIGNVHLREPNTLIIGKQGNYNFIKESKSLIDILYRTSFTGREVVGPNVPKIEREKERKITNLTAWGAAYKFTQAEPRIYELEQASFSTCPPISPAWRVKASHLVIDKNTGRGYATHARLFLKSIPVFYLPYISFSFDGQRKSGFLWPTLGSSNSWGPYFFTPFYWNMAPNYDMTIIPGVLTKRGLQITDHFRYLSYTSRGEIGLTVLPNDKLFAAFQKSQNEIFANSQNPVTQAELTRLLNDSTTRKSLFWRNDSIFNEHWSTHVDFNYAGDDYYLKDFGSNLNEITQDYLLQEGDLYYKSQHWNFTGRLQTYQILHPIDEPPVLNQYRRLPQLIFNGDYPDQAFGLDYFINNEVTHFDLLNTPGTLTDLPIGNRYNIQPGISLPIYTPYFYVNPRLQYALTQYELYQTFDTQTPNSKRRSLPIFDVASGLSLVRDASLFGRPFEQTLEPQVYYVYIPYRNQSSIPIFDTTVNTLTYDQVFNYNRFSGIDRIGDANQVGVGVATRLIDEDSKLERARLGVGEIVYFANRRVTLCNNLSCSDNPTNHSNFQRLSPLSGVFDYHANDLWSFSANTIWNPVSKQVDNATLGLHILPGPLKALNFGYSFARNGDILSGIVVNNSKNNLKLTDFSFSWPALQNITVVGRWSQDWNINRLQNLLYGVQYDTCCWAVRFVGGRAFISLDPNNNNRPMYKNDYYIQFSLKGLGHIGNGDPTGLLGAISGYNPQFG